MIECKYKGCNWFTTKKGKNKSPREEQALRMHVARVHTKKVQTWSQMGLEAPPAFVKARRKRAYKRRSVSHPVSSNPSTAHYAVNFCSNCGCPVGRSVHVAINLEQIENGTANT